MTTVAPADRDIGIGPHCDGRHDAVGAGATSAQRPVQVGVLLPRGGNNISGRRDDLEL